MLLYYHISMHVNNHAVVREVIASESSVAGQRQPGARVGPGLPPNPRVCVCVCVGLCGFVCVGGGGGASLSGLALKCQVSLRSTAAAWRR